MSKEPDSQLSISSSVSGIKTLFRSLQSQWPDLDENQLHAFGPVNIDSVRLEFANHITTIRELCSQFDTEVLGAGTKVGPGAGPAFRQQFTKLKEQAAIESTVMRVKDSLKLTRTCLASSLSQKDISVTQLQIQQLEKLALAMNLQSFRDDTQKLSEDGATMTVTTITLAGKEIVVDIDIGEDGHVFRVKVTYASNTPQDELNTRDDHLLAENLRLQRLDLFRRNLAVLDSLSRLNAKHTPTDFFLIVKGLFEDLMTIYRQEMLLLSNDVLGVLMGGHGIPTVNLGFPGISIVYWMDKELALRSDWQSAREAIERHENHAYLAQGTRLLISFEDSERLRQFLPPSRQRYLEDEEYEEDILMEKTDSLDLYETVTEPAYPSFSQPMRFVRPLPTHQESPAIPVRFVATLDPPVPASDAITRSLMTAAGLTGHEILAEKKNTIGGLTVEEMLCAPCEAEGQRRSMESMETIVKYKDVRDQHYTWTKAAHPPGRMLARIPFSHPAQLYGILQCLRQQCMFNALFQSIFSHSQEAVTPTPKNDPPLALDAILAANHDQMRVQVVTTDAPYSLHIAFSPPPTSHHQFVVISFSIDIPADSPSRPTVQLNPPNHVNGDLAYELAWDPRVFDESKMTRVIQAGHNVPLLIRWLWKRMEGLQGDYVRQTTQTRAKRTRLDGNI